MRVRARREGEAVVLEVDDDGFGARADFDGRGREGNLGLSLVSSIGESRLGGSVEFSTGEGGFSCRIRFRDTNFEARV